MDNNTGVDPRTLIEQSDMRPRQYGVIAICMLLYALDGFDVLSVSFAAPGIAEEWGTNAAALGVILSMELIGMAFGSMLLGRLADRIGRRPVVMLCIVIVSLGMFAASQAVDVKSLSIIRFATGLGLGGILATTTALVAEFSNAKKRNTAVTLMAAGFPLGSILGGGA